MSEKDFQDAVDDVLDSLPLEVIEQVAQSNTVIMVEQEPPPGESLLGVFHGIPMDQQSTFSLVEGPNRILIFQGPLQRLATSREHLLAEIRGTVLHEIGHLFGMSEERLHELGWG